MKEIKEETNKREDIACWWVGKVDLVKSRKFYYTMQSKIQCYPHQNPMNFFFIEREKILKFIFQYKQSIMPQWPK
jgi:hypothetical protein